MRLEERAQRLLDFPERFPALEPWPETETVFRLWVQPAFGPYCSWLMRDKKGEFYVRRLEWDRLRDSWPEGEPTVYGSESPVPAEVAQSTIKKLRAISLCPFVAAPGIGIDGVVSGVEIRSFSVNRTLSWWCQPPDGWQPLADWFTDTVGIFDALLPQSTAKMH